MSEHELRPVPKPTLRRLPSYRRLLKQLRLEGEDWVSCTSLAAVLGRDATQVRKDLAVTGITGRPRVGYPVTELLAAIDHFLGWDNTTDAFLVGVGNLGRALLGYRGFAENGLRIQAAFDTDPVKLGTEIHGCRVLPLEKLSNLALRMHIQIGIITVPAEAAQGVADCMVEGGIRAVWNFAPAILKTPEAVFVENEHLSSSLAVLSRRLTRTTTAMDSPQD